MFECVVLLSFLLAIQEHEERIGFLRERHKLEGKIMTLQDMLERSGDEEQVTNIHPLVLQIILLRIRIVLLWVRILKFKMMRFA